MKALTYLSLILGLIFTAQVTKAANLDSIMELYNQAKYFNDLSQELAEGVSKLEELEGCQGTTFSTKFEHVFTQRGIVFDKKTNVINVGHLYLKKCSSMITERLMSLIRSYQIEASAWSGLYKRALEVSSRSNKEAKAELTRIQHEQAAALEKLKIEANKSKPDLVTIKSIAYGALFFLGFLALGVAALAFGVGFFSVIFAFQSLAGMGPITILLLAIAGVGGTAGYVGNEGLDRLVKDEMTYTNFMSDVKIRATSLEQSQKYIDAIDENDSIQEPIKMIYY